MVNRHMNLVRGLTPRIKVKGQADDDGEHDDSKPGVGFKKLVHGVDLANTDW